ncbi:MAG: helix-turn-helix domain-containing protein [Candidatus Limnocylindria bacterium]
MRSTRTRKVVVVDNSHVARRVGDRIRQARVRAGLTQAQVSKGRYTAAYISALERGLAKPSMAALTFISERLGVAVPDLVADERPAVGRLEADLLLASGDYRGALDRYDELLERVGDDRRQHAGLLRGKAEALCRLDLGEEAIRSASEAVELFDHLGAKEDAAWARYWLAGAHYLIDNSAQAQGILRQLLADEQAGLSVAPDFRFRLLTQLGNAEAWDGDPERAIGYMEEARSLLDAVSLRQRAAFLAGLALHYRRAGDLERSIRVGQESLGLYQLMETEREAGTLELNMGITFLQLGNTSKGRSHLRRARKIAEDHADARLLSEVAEGEARLAVAMEDTPAARERAERAIEASAAGGSYLAAVGGHRILAQLARQRGDHAASEAAYEKAASLLRTHRSRGQLKDLLAEWAEARSSWGDVGGANHLYAEALGREPRRG